MPVYNELFYTKQTVDDVLNSIQDIDYEFIIINDWSDNDTRDWLNKNKKSNRIVVHQENSGVTKSWNLWVDMAKGDYICIINNDVLIPPWTFEKLISGFTDPSIMMVCPRYTQKKEDYWDRIFYLEHHIFWSFYMVDKRAKTELFPLDTRMRIFWSDNRLYFEMIYKWYKLKVMKDVVIHHFKSISSIKVPNIDHKKFLDIAKEEWRYVMPVYERDTEPTTDLIFWL